MRKAILIVLVAVGLAGCAGRTFWNSNGQMANNSNQQQRKIWDTNGKTSSNRVFWDTNGKFNQNDRKIWDNAKGQPVIK